MRRAWFAVLAWAIWALPATSQVLQPASQQITVVDSGVACSVAGACATWPVGTAPTVTIQISGTFSAVLTFEGTADGATWFSLSATNLATGAAATTATATGQYSLSNPGLQRVRLRCTTYTSGGANVMAMGGRATYAQMTRPSRTLYSQFVNTANAGDTNFVSSTAYSLPAGLMSTNGDTLRIEATYTLSAAVSTKTMQCAIGYTSFDATGGFTGGVSLGSFASTSASQNMVMLATVTRESAILLDSHSVARYNTTPAFQASVNNAQSITWANANNILCIAKDGTGNASAVTIKWVRVLFEPTA